MQKTGIVRRIDDLGRVVIPKEIRLRMGITYADPLEIFTDIEAGSVIFTKYLHSKTIISHVRALREFIFEGDLESTTRTALIEKLKEMENILE